MSEYKIIHTTDYEEMLATIESLKNIGWETLGDITFKAKSYYQSMVRHGN